MKKIETILRQAQNSFYYVEPRGIRPLNPSVDHRLPHQRWPLKLHEIRLSQEYIKRKSEKKISDFRSHNCNPWSTYDQYITLVNHVNSNFVDNFLCLKI